MAAKRCKDEEAIEFGTQNAPNSQIFTFLDIFRVHALLYFSSFRLKNAIPYREYVNAKYEGKELI